VKKHEPLDEMENTKSPSIITPNTAPYSQTYEDIKQNIFDYFNHQEYEVRQGFEEGYSRPVSEEYANTDLIRNLNDIVYDYCRGQNKELTIEEKTNFKNLHTGLQHIIKAIQQYDKSGPDKIFVAVVLGYMLKVMRNHYHD
jgi:hypothetical protein